MNGAKRKIPLPHVRAPFAATADWPLAARTVIEEIIDRYGEPNEMSADRLVWRYNSPWKRTVVYCRGRLVLEQAVEYRFPPTHIADIAQFSSNIVVRPIAEELIAVGDNERLNRILLNLAHDILIGVRTSEEAREMLKSMTGALRMNWPEEYAQQLHFEWDDSFTDSTRRRYFNTRQQV